MKTNKLFVCIAILLPGFLFVACDIDNIEKYKLVLDKEVVTIDYTGGTESVKLTANASWEVTDIPHWISISQDYGDESTELSISAGMNDELEAKIAILTFTCGEVTCGLEVRQLGLDGSKPYLKIDHDPTLKISPQGSTESIKIITNQSWEIHEIPDWVFVSSTSGKGSDEIYIQVPENRSKDERSAALLIKTDNLTETVMVSQYGLLDVLRFPWLPIFRYDMMRFSSDSRRYELTLPSMFINPGIKDKIYIGNLISHNAHPHTDIPAFEGYTFNPVTVSTSAPVENVIATFVPSKAQQDEMAQQIIARNPPQSSSYVFDNGTTEFYDYQQLHAIGMVSMGVKLDEVVSGSSYTQVDMNRHFGMVYSFKRTLFDLTMDYPVLPSLTKESIKESDKAKGVSYVCMVKYGKVGLLIAESDTDSRKVKPVIDKILQDKSLLVQEEELIQEVDFTYVYFNNEGEIQAIKGKADAVKAYRNAIKDQFENIYPIEFWLSDVDGHFINEIRFAYSFPQ